MDYLNFVASLSMIDRIHTNFSPSNDLLWHVSTDCISHLDLVDFVIYTYDECSGTLSQKAGFGIKANENKVINDPLHVSVGQGIVGDTAKRMHYQLVKDTRKDQRYIQDGKSNQSELSVPIIWEDKLLGILDSEHPIQNFYKEIHIDLFYMMASFLGPRLSKQKRIKKSFTKENKYYQQFIELMEKEHLYRKDSLSLAEVASLFAINKCYLSKIINEASNKKFTDIVNTYRVEEVKKSFQSNKQRRYTIMSLAYDAGFSSKATFNSIFKKDTGLTPSQYIKQLVSDI